MQPVCALGVLEGQHARIGPAVIEVGCHVSQRRRIQVAGLKSVAVHDELPIGDVPDAAAAGPPSYGSGTPWPKGQDPGCDSNTVTAGSPHVPGRPNLRQSSAPPPG
jgi:hypothetical protein